MLLHSTIVNSSMTKTTKVEQQQQQWGMSAPISMAAASDRDLAISRVLQEAVKSGNDISEEEMRKNNQLRETILETLANLWSSTIEEVGRAMGFSTSVLGKVAIASADVPCAFACYTKGYGRVYPFGSYRLGVHSIHSDMDVLCVGPKFFSRNMFFVNFADCLNRETTFITDVISVQHAYVPVLKCKVYGIPVDLVFAQVNLYRIPGNFDIVKDNPALIGIDRKSMLSLNGARVAVRLLQSVPNVATFRETLLAVKKWAQQRGIYSNVYGYPGGVAWAIMTARVCQLFPNAASATVFTKFFKFYSVWVWSNPLQLTPTQRIDGSPHIPWGTASPAASDDLVPILTPSFPAMNCTYNIMPSTLRKVTDEIKLALQTLQSCCCLRECITHWQPSLLLSDTNLHLLSVYRDILLQPDNFFNSYKHFLKLTLQIVPSLSSSLSSSLVLPPLAAYCESKLRHFVYDLCCQSPSLTAVPYPRSTTLNQDQIAFFIGLQFGVAHVTTTTSRELKEGSYKRQKTEEVSENNNNKVFDLTASVTAFETALNHYLQNFNKASITIQYQKRKQVLSDMVRK